MVCNRTYNAGDGSFKISGDGNCGVITQSSIKTAANENAKQNAKLRTRPRQTGGKPTPTCPATSSRPPKKTALVDPLSPISGMVMQGANLANKSSQLTDAATQGGKSCSQIGGRRKTNKRRHKSRKNKRQKSKSRKSRKSRKSSKSRKSRKSSKSRKSRK